METIKKNAVQRFLEKLLILKELKVDITKLQQTDTIETLAQKSGITREKLLEAGLHPEDPIGIEKTYLAQVYRGKKKGSLPTKEEAKKIRELGVDLKKKKRKQKKKKHKKKRNTTKEFINDLQTLQKLKVDITLMKVTDTVETLAEKSGVSRETILAAGLKPERKIGWKRNDIIRVYRGKRQGTLPTKAEEKKLRKFGIQLDERNSIQEFIEDVKTLKELGVDVSKMQQRDTVGDVAKKSGVEEAIIVQAGFQLTYAIGQVKASIVQAHRGNGKRIPPTNEEIEKMKELGISLERQSRSGQEIGKASYDALAEKCEEAQEVISDLMKREDIYIDK